MNWRTRLTGIATGDQALFVEAALFHRLGGYAALLLMEDIELSRRLRRTGPPSCLRERVLTSRRRWANRGVWRPVWLMWCLRWRYWRGTPPKNWRGLRVNTTGLRIAVMARAPVPGLAKPRLAPALGAAGAVALAEQADGALGARMARVCTTAFACGDGSLLLMGSDIPALDGATLRKAGAALHPRAAVFVPALDGGYALVGLREPLPGLLAALFDGMTWSTPQVMAQTRQRLVALGVRHAELPAVPDIDEPADLANPPAGWAIED
jgi:glycosyltransferase A (GT-A) superfamily protein (DUF2064 family)